MKLMNLPNSSEKDPAVKSTFELCIIGKNVDRYPANVMMTEAVAAQFAAQYPHAMLYPAMRPAFGDENIACA